MAPSAADHHMMKGARMVGRESAGHTELAGPKGSLIVPIATSRRKTNGRSRNKLTPNKLTPGSSSDLLG
jgi:hypothetical protein